jgi:hypothetical protein
MPQKAFIEPGENCYRFYFSGNYEHRAFISPSMPTYISFGQVGSIEKSYPPIYLVIDVPMSVMILGGRFLPGDRIVTSDVVRDGQKYRRYKLDFTYGRYVNRGSVSQLVVTTTLPPGTDALAYYVTEVAGCRFHERKLPLSAIGIPAVNPPRRLPVFLDTFAGSLTAYPTPENFRRLGFNMIGGLGGDARGLKSLAEKAGMIPMNWNNEVGSGSDDWRTVNRDGKTGEGICPTYRGHSLQTWLNQGRDLIDAGIFTHINDPERHDGENICFHERDIKRFRTYLETRFPALLSAWGGDLDCRQTWSSAIAGAWVRFKAHEYAGLLGWYAEQMRPHMRQKGLREAVSLFLYANPIAGPPDRPEDCGGDAPAAGLLRTIRNSMQDPRELQSVIAYYAPMIYLDVDGRRERIVDFLNIQRQLQCYRNYYRGSMKLVPALSAGFPFTELASELPAEVMKYQVLEAFASGAQGVAIYHEGSFDALRMKYFAEAMDQIVQVEDIFADGTVIPEARLSDLKGQTFVKGIEAGNRAVVLVSEYSQRTRVARIRYPGDGNATIIDLKSGLEIARIDSKRRDFEVIIDPGDNRARLFLINSDSVKN